MQDPFFAPNSALKAWFEPLCELLHLRTLPLHVHEIFAAFFLYHSIFEYFAPTLSGILSVRYTKLSGEGKLRWNMHCVSLVQSVLICIMSFYVLVADTERKEMTAEERVWGYTGAAGLVQATACGYFLFDLISMFRFLDIFGLPMLAHAVSCIVTYTVGFRPIYNYYGSVFLLYELSTPFLNFHWFFDKLGMTGSKAQLYNGLILLSTFFSARLVWGMHSSIKLFSDVLHAWHSKDMPQLSSQKEMMRFSSEKSLPIWLLVLYLTGHLTLNTLNIYWFTKMIEAIKKRFSKTPEKMS